jgi:RNA polymerase sigma-70 factor (ECF subfamily)
MRWLNPANREAVRLCYLEGLTQEEAAERLGLCPQAVGKRLEQARRRLRGMRRFRHLTQGGEAA